MKEIKYGTTEHLLQHIMVCEIKEYHSNNSSENVELKFVDGQFFFLNSYLLVV